MALTLCHFLGTLMLAFEVCLSKLFNTLRIIQHHFQQIKLAGKLNVERFLAAKF